MKFKFLLAVFAMGVLLPACKSKDKEPVSSSENNIDAARNFIRAALDGKFEEARSFMLQDSLNTNYMDIAERSYQHTDQAEKDGYRTATIRIFSPVKDINDSTSIVIYSNTYKNDPDTLRVVRVKGQWLVDLKYLFEHDADTLAEPVIQKDTLK